MSTKLAYRVGFLGSPVRPDVPWTRENLARLKALGFNTIQLNIAWGARPGDEPLNLEDVVSLPGEAAAALGPLPLPLDSSPGPEHLAERGAALRERIGLCRELGLRTIFHFGSPYNAIYSHWQGLDGGMRQCILDGRTPEYYVALLEAFGAQFPGVDDILVYTYDQDAWLCSEFGDCGHCRGIPLHERLVPYVNRLAATWRRISPAGRLWWSPWELSAGQVLQCVDLLEPAGLGLDLHPNIAETIATCRSIAGSRTCARWRSAVASPCSWRAFWGRPARSWSHISTWRIRSSPAARWRRSPPSPASAASKNTMGWHRTGRMPTCAWPGSHSSILARARPSGWRCWRSPMVRPRPSCPSSGGCVRKRRNCSRGTPPGSPAARARPKSATAFRRPFCAGKCAAPPPGVRAGR